MINILFCGNSKVFDGILTCLLSILKRSDNKDPINVFIFTLDKTEIKKEYTKISQKEVRFLDDVIKEYNKENKVTLIDVGNIFDEEFELSPNKMTKYSPYALIRLFADRVSNMPDKLLYLDVDIMFNQDIHLLYDIDISQYEYASARDHYGKFLINPNYINSGVLLFNLKKMKETNILSKAREILKNKKLLFPDQTALYKSTTKKLMLSQKFNDQKFLHKNTVVRHFSKRLFYFPYPHIDNVKQWHIYKVHKIFKYQQFDDIFYEYIYLKKKFESEVIYE